MALIRPMLATAGPLPADDNGWGFEFKWDGVRAISYVDGVAVRALSRNDRDVSASYPELQTLAELVDGPCVLDGEIVSLDAKGRPSFGDLQYRMHVQRPDQALLRRVPVAYYVFDVLRLGSRSLLSTPYQSRRELLEGMGLVGRRTVAVPPAFVDVDGADVLTAAGDQGLEGVVAKRLESGYEPGRRSPSWVKVPLLRTQEVVIGGWKAGEGRRAGTIGSLLLGVYDGDDRLRFAGHVGTGFDARTLADLLGRLEPLRRPDSPFDDEVPREHARHAHWVDPVLVGEVEFRSWTRDGRLRHSSWRGLRSDKAPDEVRLPADG